MHAIFMFLGAVPDPGQVQIFVKTLYGVTHVMKVRIDATVMSIKEKLCDIHGALPRDQRVIFGGRQMEDGRILSDYKVEKESTVHMVLRLCGD